ncbi:MAG: hypothetical protein LBQ60_05080 [Bacteroidales bacterium]|jgi:predicted lipoprotein|nr:hypothetical protein [Bacteroidales bacterium]
MKKFSLYFFVAALSIGMIACDNSDDDDDFTTGYGYDMTDIIDDYVDKTVLPTYEDMKNKAWELYAAVEKLNTEGGLTDANIQAACDAWRATRVPWEQSEAFLFGPADKLNLDPLLDSWPLDQTQIETVLKGGNYDAGSLGENVRGFHTVEYLLFKDGQARTVQQIGEFGPAEEHLEYLTVVTETLRNDCIKLWSAWAGEEALKGDDAEAMEEIEFTPESPSYASQFKNAGKAGSLLPSKDVAVDNIIQGCADITDEVSAQKIGGPYDKAVAGNREEAVLEVESWYSWNSITDYMNNIESIRNSYLGGREGDRGASLSAFVKSRDEALNTKVLAAIEKAYNAIKNMDSPFRNNLDNDKVKAAITASRELEETMVELFQLKN